MGNCREVPCLKKHTVHVIRDHIVFASTSMCGWRQFNEDAHLCETALMGDKQYSLFAVFDGHGGPEVAKFAQKHFVNCLVENGYFMTKNYEKALIQVFMHLDSIMQAKAGQSQLKNILEEEAIKNNATNRAGESIAGCTANVVLFTNDYIYCGNAGDSRSIAILKQSKVNKPKFTLLSQDHKPDEQSEKKRIEKAGGVVTDGRVNGSLNLSRSLGDFSFKKNKDLQPQDQAITAYPEIRKISRKDVSMILIGCDGVWQTKSAEKMTKWIHKKMDAHGKNLGKVVQALLDEEISKSSDADNGMDNMTAILVSLVP